MTGCEFGVRKVDQDGGDATKAEAQCGTDSAPCHHLTSMNCTLKGRALGGVAGEKDTVSTLLGQPHAA